MRLKHFLKGLDGFNWKKTSSGNIRTTGLCRCPLEAVAGETAGMDLDKLEAIGKRVGLPYIAIIRAADNLFIGDTHAYENLYRLRVELLKACRL